jgi:ribonuclease G
MTKEVLINAGAGEIRVAIVEDGRLQELFLERLIGLDDGALRKRGGGRSGHSLIGNIILGRVQRVLPGMQAAFVEIGLDRAGFLGAREARCLADLPGFEEDRAPKISDCVREGDEVLVQVVKDPIGEKGARLSANVTIPGRLLVMVPNLNESCG